MNGAITSAASSAIVPQRFAPFRRLTVRQRKRWAEILLSFEMANHYDAYDDSGSAALHVQEEGPGFVALLSRLFLGPLRPFHASVTDLQDSTVLLKLHRRFRFIFHRLEVNDAVGRALGAVQKKWSWVRRIYHIEDAQGRVIAELFGPLLKPWTFELRVDGRQVGSIRKRWSGLGKEMFTDADNFGVDLENVTDPALKALAFAATVLVDVVHFERSKG